MKLKKEQNDSAEKDLININKKSGNFFDFIKKRWLIQRTTTILLILILVAIFMIVNIVIAKQNFTPLDFSDKKIFTLTEDSKTKIKNVDKDVNIYFIGFSEYDYSVDIAKLYKKINNKINIETVTAGNRPDLVQKYGITGESKGIIVESGEKSKILSENDLITYDTTTYEQIDITEERLTTSILTVVTDEIPKVYLLQGYNNFTIEKGLSCLYVFSKNEIMEMENLNLLTTSNVPDDCRTLIITTPTKDFDINTTNAIINYINKGGNILWCNSAKAIEQENMPNVNKILELYGIEPFELGIIYETNSSSMLYGLPNVIIPKMQYTEVTKDLYSTGSAVLQNATKININEEKFEELNITKHDILVTSSDSIFQNNTENNVKQSFLVGAEMIKKIDEANNIESKLIIYGENTFISDFIINMPKDSEYQTNSPAIMYGKNKELAINSILYLVNRKEDISAKKGTSTVIYTATQTQDIIIRVIIFCVPLLIIIIGIIIWGIRRKK